MKTCVLFVKPTPRPRTSARVRSYYKPCRAPSAQRALSFPSLCLSHPAVLDQAVGLPRGVPHVLGRERQARDHGGHVKRRGPFSDPQRARGVLVLAAVVTDCCFGVVVMVVVCGGLVEMACERARSGKAGARGEGGAAPASLRPFFAPPPLKIKETHGSSACCTPARARRAG